LAGGEWSGKVKVTGGRQLNDEDFRAPARGGGPAIGICEAYTACDDSVVMLPMMNERVK
jgi:hypothetical protein